MPSMAKYMWMEKYVSSADKNSFRIQGCFKSVRQYCASVNVQFLHVRCDVVIDKEK